MNKTKTQTFQILFVLATVFVYFFGLGRLPLVGPDEPRYAQVAREMFERSDWITPTLGGFNWFEKPALLYWFEIAAYKIFGVNEFSARFGSAIFGLLTIFTIYLLCRFVSQNPAANNEQRTANDYANYTFILAATSIGLIVFSRAASFDIILTFPITAALACFFVSQHAASPRRHAIASLAGFYFFIGVALLAKGLIGFVLPFGVAFCYFAALRKFPSKTFLLSLIWGNLLSVLVASVWYAPMYLRHGWTFVDEFFIQHHFARYASNKFAHPEPFWFFWAILPALILPWTPFLLAAIWRVFKDQRPKTKDQRPIDSSQHSLKIFALVWLLVPLVFFSFSGSKLPGYILPALPAAIILAAEEARRFASKSSNRRLIVQIVAASIFALIVIALLFVAPDFARRDTKKYLVQAAAESGFINEKVLNLHDISHSLEFYAAGRTVRLDNGKQRQFFGASDILVFMKQTGQERVLVVVPLSRLHELPEYNQLKTEIIADNGEYAIAAVSH
ncbi:MAG TPA: glycosyltransferase family 39 protein [Pyrinomonadaceae bacterium]|jgi:4-amino-4-deoxy-L-arabinose transferase-like glycosyltransferase